MSTNQEVKKGDTLFVLDREEPFIQEIKSLEAKLSNTKATVNSYNADIQASLKNITGLQSQLELANKRVTQYQELVAARQPISLIWNRLLQTLVICNLVSVLHNPSNNH